MRWRASSPSASPPEETLSRALTVVSPVMVIVDDEVDVDRGTDGASTEGVCRRGSRRSGVIPLSAKPRRVISSSGGGGGGGSNIGPVCAEESWYRGWA